MSLFKRLTKSKKEKENSDSTKKSVAIVGLDGAGKTTIVKRILRSEFTLTRPTFGVNIEVYNYRSLEFIVYDLGGQTPLRESLWEKFITSADGLVFVLDSADKKRFELASEEFNRALSYNDKAPILFISNKIDLEDAAATDEVLEVIDFGELIRTQRKYNFTRCSALTGAQLFESWDWLTLELCEDEDMPTNNVKIQGYYFFKSEGMEVETTLFGKPKTQSKNVELFKKGRIEIIKFIKQMSGFEIAETLLQVEDKQLVLIKDKQNVIGLIVGELDPAARAVQIAKNLHEKMERSSNNHTAVNIKDLIEKHYPLDFFKDK
ncbi:MAG: ADP-ribosylation factor family protein [Candidatus Heimdallarchaeota archaeon]